MLRRYIVVNTYLDAKRMSYSFKELYSCAMPTKMHIKKLRREMIDFDRGPTRKVNLTMNTERLEKFQASIAPASASEVLDYLMECVIRGSKVSKGKK